MSTSLAAEESGRFS